MSQAKATRCGPCNKTVKDNDSTAIGCEKCSAWFHGQCVGLSPDDVATMGKIRGCFWLCSGCLEGNIFTSQAKFELIIQRQESLIEINPQQRRPRPLLVRLSSEWNARKCLAKSYKLKNFKEKIFISKSLNQEEQILKRKIFKKRYDMINNEKVPRDELKIRGLTLERNGIKINLD